MKQAMYVGVDVSKKQSSDGRARWSCPFNRESGTWKGKRMIAGGRGWIRSVLYMSNVVAVRRNRF